MLRTLFDIDVLIILVVQVVEIFQVEFLEERAPSSWLGSLVLRMFFAVFFARFRDEELTGDHVHGIVVTCGAGGVVVAIHSVVGRALFGGHDSILLVEHEKNEGKVIIWICCVVFQAAASLARLAATTY